MAADTSDKLERLPEAPVQAGGTVPTRAEHNYLLLAVRQAHAAHLCPQGELPEQTYLKLQRARELGVPLNSALALFYVVNGRVATMGRLKLALVRKSGRYAYRFEPVDNPKTEAKFTIWPKGCPDEAYTAHWTIEQARERGLAGKGAWAKYPDYMLRWRSASEGIDLVAPDACDLPLVEELAADFDLRNGGADGAVILQETEDILPRVVSAEEAPQVNDSGYVLSAKARASALSQMKYLDYPPEEAEALLAALTCDEEAQALAERLRAEAADVLGGGGTAPEKEPKALFGEDDAE